MKLTFVQTRVFAGDVMRGTGGVRKIRFAPPSWNTGKRGATRACYVLFTEAEACYFVSIFGKNDKPNLSREEMNVLRTWTEQMRKRLAGD